MYEWYNSSQKGDIMPTVSSILKDYASLSVPDQNAIKSALVSFAYSGTDMEHFVSEERFKGVSSKYLNNYLIWHNIVNYSKEGLFEKKAILLRFVMNILFAETYQQITEKKAVPV